MPIKKKPQAPQRQAAKSEAMRSRLIEATKQSLLEKGYARTTAVEVCARAGVTRGALFHHFASLSMLLAATLNEMYAALSARSEGARADNPKFAMSDFIEAIWASFGHPDFKIVIEVWLAARNDPELRQELAPVIQRFKWLASPEVNDRLAEVVGRNEQNVALYRLIVEAMIGMALGRAVSPDGRALAHEGAVVALLKNLALGMEAAPPKPKKGSRKPRSA